MFEDEVRVKSVKEYRIPPKDIKKFEDILEKDFNHPDKLGSRLFYSSDGGRASLIFDKGTRSVRVSREDDIPRNIINYLENLQK